MTNKELIEKKLKNTGEYTLGCWNKDIEKVPKTELMKVINMIEEGWTDVHVFIDKKEYIIEIATVDHEKDFNILSLEEYIKTYGKKD